MHVDGEMFVPGFPSSGGIGPVSLLINGKGTFRYVSKLIYYGNFDYVY